MTLTLENDTLRIGVDFVDAETGAPKTHGYAEINGKRFNLLSTLGASDTSDAVIRAARKEGARLGCIMTQAL